MSYIKNLDKSDASYNDVLDKLLLAEKTLLDIINHKTSNFTQVEFELKDKAKAYFRDSINDAN